MTLGSIVPWAIIPRRRLLPHAPPGQRLRPSPLGRQLHHAPGNTIRSCVGRLVFLRSDRQRFDLDQGAEDLSRLNLYLCLRRRFVLCPRQTKAFGRSHVAQARWPTGKEAEPTPRVASAQVCDESELERCLPVGWADPDDVAQIQGRKRLNKDLEAGAYALSNRRLGPFGP